MWKKLKSFEVFHTDPLVLQVKGQALCRFKFWEGEMTDGAVQAVGEFQGDPKIRILRLMEQVI